MLKVIDLHGLWPTLEVGIHYEIHTKNWFQDLTV